MKVKSERYKRGHAYYCYNCLGGAEISFCSECEEPFEEKGGQLKTSICPDCKKEKGKVIDYVATKRQPM